MAFPHSPRNFFTSPESLMENRFCRVLLGFHNENRPLDPNGPMFAGLCAELESLRDEGLFKGHGMWTDAEIWTLIRVAGVYYHVRLTSIKPPLSLTVYPQGKTYMTAIILDFGINQRTN